MPAASVSMRSPPATVPATWPTASGARPRRVRGAGGGLLRWSAHPGRVTDPDWYRANVEEAPEPRLAQREYAATPEQAFASPSGCFFERWDAAVNAPPHARPAQLGDLALCGLRLPLAGLLWIQVIAGGPVHRVAALARREPYNWTTEEFADKILKVDAALGIVEPPRGTLL